MPYFFKYYKKDKYYSLEEWTCTHFFKSKIFTKVYLKSIFVTKDYSHISFNNNFNSIEAFSTKAIKFYLKPFKNPTIIFKDHLKFTNI